MTSPESSTPPLASDGRSENSPVRGRFSTRWRVFGLAAIVALAAVLRLWQAGESLWQAGESLWIDELHTSWVVSGNLSDVLPRAAMGNQSPLYFWAMWLLVQLTGQSEWALRLPSLMAGIALPAAVFFFVGQVFNPVGQVSNLSKIFLGQVGNLSYVGLAAALLVAIDPTCIFYAQEARPYAWVMLLAAVELVLLRRLIEQPTAASRMIFLANSLVLFYLHYTAAIFLAGMVVMLPMLVRLTGSAYRTKHVIIDLVLAAALAAPGVVQMSDIFERRTNWEAFVDRPSWVDLCTHVPFALWTLAGAVIVALALLVPRVLPGNGITRGSASMAPPTTSLPSLLWYGVLLAAILIPLLLSWSVTALDAARIFYVRYLAALIPLAAAAACLAIAWIPWRMVQMTALVALAGWQLYGGGIIQQFARDGRFLAMRNEDWRGAIDHINAALSSDSRAKLILDPNLIESGDSRVSDFQEYSRFALHGLYHVVCPDDNFIDDPADKELPIDVHQGDYDVQAVFLLFNGPPPRQILYVRRGDPKGARNDGLELVARLRRALSRFWPSAADFDVRGISYYGNVQVTVIAVKSDVE